MTSFHPTYYANEVIFNNHDASLHHQGKGITTTSACLLVMDDNHFLVEWLAYHYHTANLRRLVVAIDPKSTTSPLEILSRWKGRIEITVWKADSDYASHEEREEARLAISQTFRETTPSLIDHRARQRLFYTHCLRSLKNEQAQRNLPSAWTMLVDVDEFVRVNYKVGLKWESSVPQIDQPGSVAAALERLSISNKGNSPSGSSPPWESLKSSPCIPLPRLRFVSQEDNPSESTTNNRPSSNKYLTQHYLGHARGDDFNKNKISKTVIDLSLIPIDDIVGVDSIHMPIRKYCSQRNRYVSPKDSLLVINHYLGSLEQFTDRENDARNEIVSSGTATADKDKDSTITTKVNVRNSQHFQQQQKLKYTPENDDEILPWLEGFLNTQTNNTVAHELLRDSGKLAPKSWKPIFSNTDIDDRCALLFFGLTRSYKDMVLPSIVENILKPNARHRCDVFVHFYAQETEDPGRRNFGGPLQPDDIGLLEDAVQTIARNYYESTMQRENEMLSPVPSYEPPIISFAHDTLESFLERRKKQLDRYQREETIFRHDNGTESIIPAYFPFRAKSYVPSSLDNIVRQWHSIASSFQLMDYVAKAKNHTYSRVGMFRSDCLYVTPIDIASLNQGNDKSSRSSGVSSSTPRYDVNNQYIVTPGFALHPVNDRMVYGPYDAVKIWATKRFELLEEWKAKGPPGYIMHSERFLNGTILPPLQDLGFRHFSNGHICFLRTRVGGSAFVNDCSIDGLLPTPQTSREWNAKPTDELEKHRLSLVESIVGIPCTLEQMSSNHKWTSAVCKS